LGAPDREGGSNPWPDVAWLLTYPNSGTGFTLLLTQVASGRSTGTNYGYELTNNGISYLNNPEFSRSINGPFKMSRRPLPSTYILTKTHCAGGHCDKCPPNEYVIDSQTFTKMCLTGHRNPLSDEKNAKEGGMAGDDIIQVRYAPQIVKKAVHLIRSPFDNVAARFHYVYELHKKKNTNVNDFPFQWNRDGFREYCKDLDTLYTKDEEKAFPGALVEIMKPVPCHVIFFKYLQWHNNAFSTTQLLNINTLVIHYEDYKGDMFRPTLSRLLDFLELPDTGRIKEFHTESNYEDFYTNEERIAIMSFVDHMGSEDTKRALERYFDRSLSR